MKNESPDSIGFSLAQTVVLVEILVAVPKFQTFTYSWAFEASPVVGQRVLVPWGRQFRVGLVYRLELESSIAADVVVKPVAQVLDDGICLSQAWWRLIEFAARYYHAPLGMVALEALPKALRVLNAKGCEPVMVSKARQQSWKAKTLDAEVNWPVLNEEQVEAVRVLSEGVGFQPWLLYGITGSGKTEVYLQVIARRLARGEQVLVLLPEINLTPAALLLYQARFSAFRVVVLHSNLAEMQRTKAWYAAALGEADVVIATRLGVLTPLPRLGFVVVDEEHDPSYKQQEGMRYQARDLAVMLAHQRDCPVVLGSATPSLESWKKAQQGDYRLLRLTQRAVAGAVLPTIEIVSTLNFPTVQGFSEPVILALRETVAAGRQAIVFLNRRGYAPQLACNACGWVAHCQYCTAHMVWHKRDHALRCHHCGAGQAVPHACVECGNQDLTPLGSGTQRLEEILEGLLPQARVLRLDADSTRNKGQMEALLAKAHAGEVDVLVGTQMISKGHDFANVGLVVALNVDASLYSHAYRAPERLFAQLMQVAGRAGRRGGAGRMLVQTRYPQHPLFAALLAHDYEQFATVELQGRQEACMPPFAWHVLLRAEHRQLAVCLEFLKAAKEYGETLVVDDGAVFVCDPVPLNVVRVGGVERAQLLVESQNRLLLHRFLDQWLAWLQVQKSSVKWFVEVDPVEL